MMNRREMFMAMSAFAALGTSEAVAQTATVATAPSGTRPGAEKVLSASETYVFEKLPVKENANGFSRPVAHGVLPTGETVEMHETTLLPGHMPHPAHKHRHSEFMMIREGQIEFYNEDKTERVGPGGVIFASSGLLHGMKNIGDTPANYFVIAIGRETA